MDIERAVKLLKVIEKNIGIIDYNSKHFWDYSSNPATLQEDLAALLVEVKRVEEFLTPAGNETGAKENKRNTKYRDKFTKIVNTYYDNGRSISATLDALRKCSINISDKQLRNILARECLYESSRRKKVQVNESD